MENQAVLGLHLPGKPEPQTNSLVLQVPASLGRSRHVTLGVGGRVCVSVLGWLPVAFPGTLAGIIQNCED